jgi:hypothetical protein
MFDELLSGKYYPSVSLYMGARVRFNFGPRFAHAPSDVSFSPFCDALHVNNSQLTLLDVLQSIP